MSLLDSALAGNRKTVTEEIARRVKGEGRVTKIVDSAKFVSIAKDVCERNLLDDDELHRFAKHRSRVQVQPWPVRSLMSNGESEHTGVTAKTWAAIVKAAIEGMVAQIKLSAPNGAWAIAEYECRIVEDPRVLGGQSAIVLVVKFLDTINGEDWTYTRGRPDVSQVRNSGLNAEDLAALMAAFLEAGDQRTNDRFSDLLTEMKALISSSNESESEPMPEFPEAPAEVKAPTKAKPGRTPRKKGG